MSLGNRIKRLEISLGVDDANSLPKVIIISVVGAGDGLERDSRDKQKCCGIMSCGSGGFQKITRLPGESINELDERLERLLPRNGMSIPSWIRAYTDDPADRQASFSQAQELGNQQVG